jgi:hypothetical protein
MILANISNGLAFPHDEVCYFQSTYGHKCKSGYFRIDSMPLKAVIHLLCGGELNIVDATQHNKPMTDAQKFGVATWCLVYNRAIRQRIDKVCSWQTRDMERVASSNIHKKLIKTIRKLAKYYPTSSPAVIGENVSLICFRNFTGDDKPEHIREKIRRRYEQKSTDTKEHAITGRAQGERQGCHPGRRTATSSDGS